MDDRGYLFVERVNVAPEAREDWERFSAQVLVPCVQAASGGGATVRYRSRAQPRPIVPGSRPEYLNLPVDWEATDTHVQRVYQYVNVYEVSPAQRGSVLAAAETAAENWSGARPFGAAVYGIRALYEQFGGTLPVSEFPDLCYFTRFNIPEHERESWETNYAPHHALETGHPTGRPGIGRASCYKLADVPHYFNWWGPSLAYHYVNLYTLLDEHDGMASAFVSDSAIVADRGPAATRAAAGQLTGVRAVYEKLP
jgi:hypothetical protein